MKPCDCTEKHERRRVVLTGGPGAGKTAVLELIRLFFCVHLKALKESAGIVFGGGFPRGETVVLRQAAQRAIYHVQRELETTADAENAALVLCDRGTVDGAAYWPGPGDLWSAHPRRFVVESSPDFLTKASYALAILRDEVPECCRHRVSPFLWAHEKR